MAFLPFSQRAKLWEPVAVELRRLGGARDGAPVDPFVLAERVGLRLVSAESALEGFCKEDRDHLLRTASGSWSGGVYPRPLPDGMLVCIINPTHDPRRNKITLMEEVVHVHRRHKPSGLRDVLPGLRVREYHDEHEAEAYGIGAAVLLPWDQFYHQLNAGVPIAEISGAFDVTEHLIEYRIKVTGATNLYRNRAKRSLPPGARREPTSVIAESHHPRRRA